MQTAVSRKEAKEYSLFAHLKPESIIVSVGEAVKRGEKLAECGNSGNTTEPHLHFQTQQLGKSFYSAPGLPIEFQYIAAENAPNYDKSDVRRLSNPGKSSYPPYIEVGLIVHSLNDDE